MIVRMCMTRDVVTIAPKTSIAEAAALMARRHVRRLPVVERNGEESNLLGIVSATDIIRVFPPNVNPFAVEIDSTTQTAFHAIDIMNPSVQTTTPGTPIEEAAAMLYDQKIGALPVFSGKKMVGIITESDIFRVFVRLFTSAEPGVRITFDMSKREDVFDFVAGMAKRYSARVTSLIRTDQEDRPECVVRITGDVDSLVDELWRSGHPVLSVLRFPRPRLD